MLCTKQQQRLPQKPGKSKSLPTCVRLQPQITFAVSILQWLLSTLVRDFRSRVITELHSFNTGEPEIQEDDKAKVEEATKVFKEMKVGSVGVSGTFLLNLSRSAAPRPCSLARTHTHSHRKSKVTWVWVLTMWLTRVNWWAWKTFSQRISICYKSKGRGGGEEEKREEKRGKHAAEKGGRSRPEERFVSLQATKHDQRFF